MLRSDAAKKVMLNRLADGRALSVLAGMEPPAWLGNRRSRSCRCPGTARADALPKKGNTLPITFRQIVGSVDESFRLLMEICDLPEVSRTDFVIEGVAALGNEIDESAAVSAILPHVRSLQPCSGAKAR